MLRRGKSSVYISKCTIFEKWSHSLNLVVVGIFPLTAFSLIGAPGAYLILKLWDAALIGGRRLKEGGTYYKVREIIHEKF